jgi:hypothetical protein
VVALMPMLTVCLIGLDDYSVREDGHTVGLIRLAHERTPAVWLWTITVTIPGPPFGDAATLDELKGRRTAAHPAMEREPQ